MHQVADPVRHWSSDRAVLVTDAPDLAATLRLRGELPRRAFGRDRGLVDPRLAVVHVVKEHAKRNVPVDTVAGLIEADGDRLVHGEFAVGPQFEGDVVGGDEVAAFIGASRSDADKKQKGCTQQREGRGHPKTSASGGCEDHHGWKYSSRPKRSRLAIRFDGNVDRMSSYDFTQPL